MSDPSATPVRPPCRVNRFAAVALVLATAVMLVLAYAVVSRLAGGDSGDAAGTGLPAAPAAAAPSIEELFTEGDCDSLDLSGFEAFAGLPLDEDPSPPEGWSRESETTGEMVCGYSIEYDEEAGGRMRVELEMAVFADGEEAMAAFTSVKPTEDSGDWSTRPLEGTAFTGVIAERDYTGGDDVEVEPGPESHYIGVTAVRDNFVVYAGIEIDPERYATDDATAVLTALAEQSYAMCGYFIVA